AQVPIGVGRLPRRICWWLGKLPHTCFIWEIVMAELSESVQALQRELTAARQAFDHAHFSSTAHQEQVVSNAKQLIPAAVAQCVAQGAGLVGSRMLRWHVR